MRHSDAAQKREEDEDEDFAMIQQRAEHIAIAVEEAVEAALEAVLHRDERPRPARGGFLPRARADCCRSNHMTSVGTSVRERTYEASTAKTTASASGTKR